MARHVGRGDNHGTTAIGDHTALEQPQRMGDQARFQDIVDGDVAHADEFQIGHGLDRFRVAHGMTPRGHGDMGKLLVRGAILKHVAGLDHGIIANEGQPPRVFHIVDKRGRANTGGPGRANGAAVGMGRGAIGDQRHVALASSNHGEGMVGLKLKGAPAHIGGIDDARFKAKIFRNAQAADILIAAVS